MNPLPFGLYSSLTVGHTFCIDFCTVQDETGIAHYEAGNKISRGVPKLGVWDGKYAICKMLTVGSAKVKALTESLNSSGA